MENIRDNIRDIIKPRLVISSSYGNLNFCSVYNIVDDTIDEGYLTQIISDEICFIINQNIEYGKYKR